jgi:hypothetical protein
MIIPRAYHPNVELSFRAVMTNTRGRRLPGAGRPRRVATRWTPAQLRMDSVELRGATHRR